MKERYDHRLLLKHLPSDFRQFLDHLQSLEYADKPDYAMLFGLFERTMKRRGVRDSDPFDWEKAATDNLGLSGIATPTANRDNNKVDANVDNNQENLEPDNRKELRITELDKKRLGFGVTSTDADLVPLSPRLKESVSVGGGVVVSSAVAPTSAFDRNANANNVVNIAATANGSTEEKGAEDREKHEKIVAVDKEGDAVMADEEKRRNSANMFHRDSGLFALDVTRTEGDLCEPLSPSTRIGREVWTTMSTAAATVTSPAPPAATNESGGQSLISFNTKGTLERRSGRRMHMSVTASGSKSSLKYRSVPTYGDNSVTQMAMMEDDNVSQAVTHGGAGGMTLHSRWKSQFDDSEGSENETEMKGEQLQSPEHKQDEETGVEKEDGLPLAAMAAAETAGQSSPQRLVSPTKPMPREDPPKCPPPPLLTLMSHPEEATAAAAKGTNAASTHSSTTTNTRSAVVIPPPPQLAPPPPPPDFVPLQHSASAPSMNPNAAAGPVAANETASGGRSPTTKGMSGFTPPPPPQFAPPPPPVTATLASTITATPALFTRPNMTAPSRPALQHSISSGCVGSGSSVDPHLLQERSSSRHLAAAQEDDESRNDVGQDNNDDEEEEEEDGEDEQQDAGGQEEDEEDDYVRNEYVAAVCRYTTIVNDVPPGFDNEAEEERNGSSSNTRSSSTNNRADSKGTRSQHSQATRLRQTLEDTVYRVDRSNKIIRELSSTPNRDGSTEDDDLAAAADHGSGLVGSSNTTTGKFSIKLEKGEYGRYFLSHGNDTTGTTSHSKDDSSDEPLPHAVFIRPTRMRIFQTELEDEEGEEDDEDQPPVPPPRSKSKESATKSPTRSSPNERSVYYDAIDER